MNSFRNWRTPLLLSIVAVMVLQPASTLAQETATVTIVPLGTYASGTFDGAAAGSIAYDPATSRAFVPNAADQSVDILSIVEPATPLLEGAIDISAFGEAATSVAVSNGVLAVSVEANKKTKNGTVVFFSTDGAYLSDVEVGPTPRMLAFTPDARTLVVANAGEPNDSYEDDPEGSISIIDLSSGMKNLKKSDVSEADFGEFDRSSLDPSVRIFGPGAGVAQDLEPEAVAIAADSATAWVTLQENNAIAVVDLGSAAVTAILPLGVKDHSRPFVLGLTDFEMSNMPTVGTTAAGQNLLLGGFSGLQFEGVDAESGALNFVTHTDRGPNANPVDLNDDGQRERPFALPDFAPRVVRFSLDPATGEVIVTETLELRASDGETLTGLPNMSAANRAPRGDEPAIDLYGNALPYVPLGADPEGIAFAGDGSFWIVDEYRPSIYHFDPSGSLIQRYVPQGDNSPESGIEFGVEALPAMLSQRTANHGFEAAVLEGDILYAFVQSPLDNPNSSNDASAEGSTLARIIAFDTATEQTVGMYLYPLQGDGVDKIGDAIALGNREFVVLERDDATGPDAGKYLFRISLVGATNLLEAPEPTGLELMVEQLGAAGIRPVLKRLYVDLAAAGYVHAGKPEGLARVDDGTLAIINDNDFGLLGSLDPATGLLDVDSVGQPSVITLLDLQPTALDASDRDGGAHFATPPVVGMFQPGAIAAWDYNGSTWLVTANEGESRDYGGFSEETRVKDLLLDLEVFPDAGALQQDESIGRLRTSTEGADSDGDGFVDLIHAFGGRSFSIWDSAGNLVWDSGDDFERILAERYPADFNSDSVNGTADQRSDDRGPEPNTVALGEIDGRTYAFVGLERMGGVMVYDISNPLAPTFVEYVNTRDYTGSAADGAAGDLAPAGLQFVSGMQSPTGGPLLLVANELSGTTTVFSIEPAHTAAP